MAYDMFVLMNDASPLTVYSVLILAGIVVVQTIFLVAANLLLRRRLIDVEPKLVQASSRATMALEQSRELLERLASLQEKLPVWQENVSRWTDRVNTALVEMDEHAKHWLQAARDQSQRADRKTDWLVLRFSEKAAEVQESVSSPARHVSAAVTALKAAVSRYFASRNENTPYDFHPDQDDFI